jgi:hypothetical protein
MVAGGYMNTDDINKTGYYEIRVRDRPKKGDPETKGKVWMTFTVAEWREHIANLSSKHGREALAQELRDKIDLLQSNNPHDPDFEEMHMDVAVNKSEYGTLQQILHG